MIIRYTDETGTVSIEEGIDNPTVENVAAIPENADTGQVAVAGYTRVVAFKIDKVTGMRSGSAFMPRPGLGDGVATVEILTDSGVTIETVILG